MTENTFALIFSLLFIIVLYIIIFRHNKKNKKIYLQQKEDSILYEKDRKMPPTNTSTIFPSEFSYRSKKDYFLIAQSIGFIIFGLLIIYLNRFEENLLHRYIGLLFLIFGILILYGYLFTIYHVKEKNLIIKHGISTNIVDYKNITKIEKHIINIYFRHGTKGRKRAETHKDTLWIYYTDNNNVPRIIMISPLEKDKFFDHIISKIGKTPKSAFS